MVLESIVEAVGHTPLFQVGFSAPRASRGVYLKHEGFNPSGSIYDRSAVALYRHAHAQGCSIPLEGSGYAPFCASLALVGVSMQHPVYVDPDDSSPINAAKIARALGARSLQDELLFPPDDAPTPNPAAFLPLLDEIEAQRGGPPDVLCIPWLSWFEMLSIKHSVGALWPNCRLVVAWGGSPWDDSRPPHYVTNLTRMPSDPVNPGPAQLVPAQTAWAFCHYLANRFGIMIDPGAGAALATGLVEAASSDSVVVIAPEAGELYLDTIFAPDWITDRGFRVGDSDQLVEQWATRSVQSTGE